MKSTYPPAIRLNTMTPPPVMCKFPLNTHYSDPQDVIADVKNREKDAYKENKLFDSVIIPSILQGQFSNKAPNGWDTHKHHQIPYFHTYEKNQWIRRRDLEFGPFPQKTVTVYSTRNDSRGFIISAGEYECDGRGENCALKYQDEVESNISFADWESKRDKKGDTNAMRRPVLGKAAPWKKLACAKYNKLDDYEERKCGGSVGGDKDCQLNGVWGAVTVPGWTAANKTFDDAKKFCNDNDSCVGIAQSSYNSNWPITRTDLFLPCDGPGCTPRIKYFNKKVNRVTKSTKIDEIDFSEFVVRQDCPKYTKEEEQDFQNRDTTSQDVTIEDWYRYPSCWRGVKANAPVHYTHSDRTDPSRMKNRIDQTHNERALREPILTTPHICEFHPDKSTILLSSTNKSVYDLYGYGVINKAGNEGKWPGRGHHLPGCKPYPTYVPVDTLSNTEASLHDYQKNWSQKAGGFGGSRGNVFPLAFGSSKVNVKESMKVNWRNNAGEIVKPHLIPPSYKGWIWCEDVNEPIDGVFGNHPYCTGAHHGNQINDKDQSFKSWGAEKSELNKKTVVGGFPLGFTYMQDFNKRGYGTTQSGSVAYQTLSEVRPMTNALVLKNDEAGIDGIKIYCSNRQYYENEIPRSILRPVKTVTTNPCNKDETLCSINHVSAKGTGLIDTGQVIFSTISVVPEFTGKCSNGELTEDECKEVATSGDNTYTFKSIDDSDKPKNCSMGEESGNIHIYFNTGGHEEPSSKLCPRFIKTILTAPPVVKNAFCCPKDNENVVTSASYVDTQTNINNNLHYEYMCTDGGTAIHLCDPATGNIKGKVEKDPTTGERIQTCDDLVGDLKCQYVPIDAFRYGNKAIKDVNWEAKQYFNEKYEWGGNAGNNGTKKVHKVSCSTRGGVCGIAAKVMEIETKPGMGPGKDARWGGGTDGSMQYWFESAKFHKWKRIIDEYGDDHKNMFHSIDIPHFGTHRQDMQGITNVEVMCCDGHSELAIKGDNGPNESSIANVTYNVTKQDLTHLLGCVGSCTEERLITGCTRMGGEWSSTHGRCNYIPNDNPTGSWQQVNTLITPSLDRKSGTMFAQEGGDCCEDDISKYKDRTSGKPSMSVSKKECQAIDDFQASVTMASSTGAPTGCIKNIYTRQYFYNDFAGDQQCFDDFDPNGCSCFADNEHACVEKRKPMTVGDEEVKDEYDNESDFLGVMSSYENPGNDTVNILKGLQACFDWDNKCCQIKNKAGPHSNVKRRYLQVPWFPKVEFPDFDSPCEQYDTKQECDEWNTVCDVWNDEVCESVRLYHEPEEPVNLWGAAVSWVEDRAEDIYEDSGAKEEVEKAKEKVEKEVKKICTKTCKTLKNTTCKVYKTVRDTTKCLLKKITPKITCQTGYVQVNAEMDQPVRYRRTARYGKKAHGHINVIPGRWTPAFGCLDNETNKAVPLENVLIGHNQQQKAHEWRTEDNNSNNPGAIWFSHGWGDQMGITSIGFICPEGSHYGQIGKKHAPYSNSTSEAREWDSTNHVGHQDNSVFLPEYRQAGMFNAVLHSPLSTPNMYKLCSDKGEDGDFKKRSNIDDWGKNCNWYFEGYRRRNTGESKVDGDLSTGGAWSEIDLGVWSRNLEPRDRCFDAMKNRFSGTEDWPEKLKKAKSESECTAEGGTWIAPGSPGVKIWGFGSNICVRSCSVPNQLYEDSGPGGQAAQAMMATVNRR